MAGKERGGGAPTRPRYHLSGAKYIRWAPSPISGPAILASRGVKGRKTTFQGELSTFQGLAVTNSRGTEALEMRIRLWLPDHRQCAGPSRTHLELPDRSKNARILLLQVLQLRSAGVCASPGPGPGRDSTQPGSRGEGRQVVQRRGEGRLHLRHRRLQLRGVGGGGEGTGTEGGRNGQSAGGSGHGPEKGRHVYIIVHAHHHIFIVV